MSGVFGQNWAEQGYYLFTHSPHKKVYLTLQVFLGLLKVSHFDDKFICIPRKSFACGRLTFCVEELFHEEVPEELWFK